jgi:hypothetical protein
LSSLGRTCADLMDLSLMLLSSALIGVIKASLPPKMLHAS